jgi:16S rRNA (adenine1518-N6/adenine1519-N6)-dimethyltransferase
VRKLVAAVAPEPSDRFLEIGAGRGALTGELAPLVRRLTAIEIDRQLAETLAGTAPAHVAVVEGDVLQVDLAALVRELADTVGPPGRVRIVGNLPYNISSPILFRLMTLARDGAPLYDATIMLQREVADRVAAAPGTGDWGPLAIAIQLRADVTRRLALPPGAFRPPPRVHSTVLQLRFRQPQVEVRDEPLFDSVVRAVFGQRRKTLLNALRPFASARGSDAREVLQRADVDPQRRPETLTLEEFARLTAVVASAAPSDAGDRG